MSTIDEGHAANVLAQMLHMAGGGTFNATAGYDSASLVDGGATASSPDAPDTSSPLVALKDGADAVGLVNPTVSQEYGVNNHPGIDLAVPAGTPLVAAADGVVTVASNIDPGGYGNEVEITLADGTVMRYGHLTSISVQEGQQIKAGTPVGKSGGDAGDPGAGNSTGAHLHFEVRKGNQSVDPVPYLAGGAGVVAGNAVDNPAVAGAGLGAGGQARTLIDAASGKKRKGSSPKQLKLKKIPGRGAVSASDGDPNGVEAFLAATRTHESGGDYTIYNQSGLSNASGAYQFLGSTWQGLGGSTANAAEASPAEQDAIARRYALSLFDRFHSWRLVAIAWYGGPGVAEQVARGVDPGSPDGQGGYLDYGDTIVRMMNGGK